MQRAARQGVVHPSIRLHAHMTHIHRRLHPADFSLASTAVRSGSYLTLCVRVRRRDGLEK